MACSFCSVVSSDESFLLHSKSRLPIGEKYNPTGDYSYGSVVVRMYCSKRNSRYMKLKANQICRGLGSRFSNLFRCEMDKVSSIYDNSTSKPEVTSNIWPLFFIFTSSISMLNSEKILQRKMKFQFHDAVTFTVWKQWSYVSSAAILIIFTLLVIPNANAVDALKTCACLLKECRQYILLITSSKSLSY